MYYSALWLRLAVLDAQGVVRARWLSALLLLFIIHYLFIIGLVLLSIRTAAAMAMLLSIWTAATMAMLLSIWTAAALAPGHITKFSRCDKTSSYS